MAVEPMEMHPSTILIHYDNIIKCGDLFILRNIQKKYREKFEKYLDFEYLDGLDDQSFWPVYCARDTENPFKWLMKSKFDYESNYKYFKKKYINMYDAVKPMNIVDPTIKRLLVAYFVTRIGFYMEEHDDRIVYDLYKQFGENSKIDIISDCSIDIAIKDYHPNAVFYPYLDKILPTARENRNCGFIIPNYGFNISELGVLKGLDDTDVNLGVYPVASAESIYFG